MMRLVVGIGARPFPSMLLLLWSLVIVMHYHTAMVIDGALSQADQGPYLGKWKIGRTGGRGMISCILNTTNFPCIGLINSHSCPFINLFVTSHARNKMAKQQSLQTH